MIKRSSSAGKSRQSEEPVLIVDVKQPKNRKNSAKKKDVIGTKPIEVKVESLKMETKTKEIKTETKLEKQEPSG